MKEYDKPRQSLFSLGFMDDPLTTVRLSQSSLSSNHLASNDNLTNTTRRQNTYHEN